MEQKTKLVVVCGPTASGKTAIGIELAKKLNAEIVSADSMQIYKFLNIGTAKPNEKEMQGITHHMLDIIDPNDDYSVAKYCDQAKACIEDITARGKLSILVGGTGLYINSLIDNIEFSKMESDAGYRDELKKTAAQKGNEYIHSMLSEVDPESAERLHVNDINRIIRALEVHHSTGVSISEHNRKSRLIPSKYDICMIGLNFKNRDDLYRRIDMRVDKMIADGLIDEVKELLAMGISKGSTSMQAIGYKQIIGYLSSECTLSEAIDTIKRESRRYAKRQLTWFRRDERINWIELDNDFSLRLAAESAFKIVSDTYCWR